MTDLMKKFEQTPKLLLTVYCPWIKVQFNFLSK